MDYFVLIPIWGLYIFALICILALGRYNTVYSGFSNAINFFIFFGFLPFGLTMGLIGDRYFAQIELKNYPNQDMKLNNNSFKLNREDKIRLILLIVITFLTIPYFNALTGFFVTGINITIPLYGIEGLKAQIWPFFPVHLGLNHGWLGYFLLVCAILNSKIEKLFEHNAFSELIILGFCFISIWGAGWLINDFVTEQIAQIFPGASFPFLTPSTRDLFNPKLAIQFLIVFVLAYLMFHFGWTKYYKPRILEKE
ncbi:MAG: hypothetical protein ACTSRG_20075 [Candidatus Helarchaeota archaeon]